MLNHRVSSLTRYFVLLFLVFLIISGCTKPTDQPPVPTEPAATLPPTDAPTPVPTAPAARLLLVDPAESASTELASYLSGFAAQNGLQLETVNTPELPPQTPETRLVIFLAEPAGLAELAAASPETQFIIVGDVALTGAGNLSVVQTRGYDLTFMAGYLTQSIAWDWRSAGLIPADVVMSAEKTDAFINGARYLCGVCTPFYAPIVSFPMLAQESMQADAATWAVQVDVLRQHFVNTFFVDPAAASIETLDGLKGLEPSIFNDVKLVGLDTTQNADRFTALIGFDVLPGLQLLLPQVTAGSGRLSVGAQVKITSYTDETFITPAKIDNFNKVAADLAAGIIIPLSMP